MTQQSSLDPQATQWFFRDLVDRLETALEVMRHGPIRVEKGLSTTATLRDGLLDAIDGLQLLIDGQPMPSGRSLPAQPTTKYLKGLALEAMRQHKTPAEHRGDLAVLGERPSPRTCSGTRRDGQPCQQWAMVWLDRAVCTQHATPEEVEQNRSFDHAYNEVDQANRIRLGLADRDE